MITNLRPTGDPRAASDVYTFAENCNNGITYFRTVSDTTGLPSSGGWNYSSGLVLKRSDTGIALLLFPYSATSSYTLAEAIYANGTWSSWKLI